MAIYNTGKKDKDGNTIWRIQLYMGAKAGGGYARVTERVHGSKKDARARERELEESMIAGVRLDIRVRFKAYAAEWLEGRQAQLAPRTYAGYRLSIGYLNEALGSVRMADVNAPVVRHALKVLGQMPKQRGEGTLSDSTVAQCYRVLHAILGQAVKDELVKFNACDRVDPPKVKHRERRALNEAQYRMLLEAVQKGTEAAMRAYWDKEERLRKGGHQNKPRQHPMGVKEVSNLAAVMLALKTGMRPSEILALQWRHVSFPEGCIEVRQATATNRGGVKETKSDAGARTLYLDGETLEYLATLRSFVSKVANSFGIELDGSSWVVCSNTFTQVDHTNLNRWWNEWRKDAGFDGWELYELRHTQATLLLKAGVDVKDVQTRLGHSSATVTLKNYAHASEDVQRNLVNALPSIS